MALFRFSRHFAALVAAPLLLNGSVLCAQGPAAESTQVDATLIADVRSIAPGVPFRLGVRFDMADTWHINWINPGDAGLAPSIAWALPDGFRAGALAWPYPGRFDSGPLTIFGYGDRVILWATVTPSDDLRPGQRVELAADVDWLACQEACIPGQARVSLTLPVETSEHPDTAAARAFDTAARRVPAVVPNWEISARYDEDQIALRIDPAGPEETLPPTGLFFYPDAPGIIDNAGHQREEIGGSGITLTVPRSTMVRATPERLTGVVVAERGWGPGGPEAIRIDVALEPR
jgi:thiol:disulfide interchange protein DsbD